MIWLSMARCRRQGLAPYYAQVGVSPLHLGREILTGIRTRHEDPRGSNGEFILVPGTLLTRRDQLRCPIGRHRSESSRFPRNRA